MIHKYNFKGHTSYTPFKVFYLADEAGVNELCEAYAHCLILDHSKDNNNRGMINSWIMGKIVKDFSDFRAGRIYNPYTHIYTEQTLPISGDVTVNKQFILEDMGKRISAQQEQLDEVFNTTTHMVVPLILVKGTLKYLVNRRSSIAKAIVKAEELHTSGPNWWQSAEAHYAAASAEVLKRGSWSKEFKLVSNQKLFNHPCTVCPRAMKALDGECSLGGSHCNPSLAKGIINVTPSN